MSNILAAAYRYADTRNLVRDPFRSFRYRIVEVSPDGSTSHAPEQTEGRLPKRLDRSSDVTPNYMQEHASWLLGGRGREKFDAYWEALGHVMRTTGLSQEADRVSSFRRNYDINKFKELPKDLADAWIVPAVDGIPLDQMDPLVERWGSLWRDLLSPTQIHENWLEVLGIAGGKTRKRELTKRRCLVTGEMCYPARTHGKVEGIPGTDGKVSLTSFNMPTYCYDGRHKGDNYPISRAASMGYTQAMTELLGAGGASDIRRGAVLTGEIKRSRFEAGSAILVWSESPEDDLEPMLPIFSRFLDDETARIGWDAVESMTRSDSILSVLQVRGATGRASVLGWDQLRLGEAATNLLRFREEALQGSDSIGRLLQELQTNRKTLSQEAQRDIILSSLTGIPVTRKTAAAVVSSLGSPGRDETVRNGKKCRDWTWKNPRRIAFLQGRAGAARTEREMMMQTGDQRPSDCDGLGNRMDGLVSKRMTEVLQARPSTYIKKSHPEYLLGFLVGVCAELQRASLRRWPNHGIRDRFGRPPSNPRRTLSQLHVKTSAHYGKTKRHGRESDMRAIHDALIAEIGDSLPDRSTSTGTIMFAGGLSSFENMKRKMWVMRKAGEMGYENPEVGLSLPADEAEDSQDDGQGT